jgi:hypothetical protein
MRRIPAEFSLVLHLPLCSMAKNDNVGLQRECDMTRLSKLTIVRIAKQIALAVTTLAGGPAPVLIPIPVHAKRESQMTRRIR